MSNIAWGRFLTWSTIIIGSGYAIMKTTVPSSEELYSRLSPDLQRKADEIRNARRQSELQRQIEEAHRGGASAPVWAEPPNKT